ncbi:autotransporter outer membrane beta-barrel domain-containing protein [Roseibacterium sp. SDUM158016]|uniref:autotransporter outer membrane beta-barrel domain-containing protein n=1 Tax=Roseicyclus sediminis TaxID=2980997 RepID=UPI0021D043AD|nr:autotransporter outer membrane beta-barrel domain-containing protein [Roseibacterium sp. SDUM158016]MCU4654759.1 autotransporter outer membrane beta-barrel domain-containing protein [Roseibacterium sp. SDUM158016]
MINAGGLAGDRGQDSLTTRDAMLSFTRVADPETGELQVTQSTMAHEGMMGEVYTWIDLTGFRAEDDGTNRAYSGRGLQIGADIALGPDMVAGLSFGVQDLDGSVGTVSQDGVLRYLQPYFAYRSGAWAGEASLLYGHGDFSQSSGGGDGTGETRLTALTFSGGYDIALQPGVTVTPMLGLVHGVERIEGVSGTLAGAGRETVRFTQASFGAEISQTIGGGELFGGLHADWLDTSSDTALVSDLLIDDGWTGRLELGLSTEIGGGVLLDTSVELSGLGGDLRSTSGSLRFAFRF